MELPSRVVDELRGESLTTRWLLICIYRYGTARADSDGRRVAYLKASQRKLERLTGISKRAIVDAQRALLEGGFVRVHQPLRAGATQSISAPLDWEGGADFAPGRGFGAVSHDGGDPDLKSLPGVKDTTITHTLDDRAVQVLHQLRELGVNGGERLLEQHGAARCEAAAAIAASSPTSTNPAGLVVTLLRSGRELVAPAAGRGCGRYHGDEVDCFECRRDRYLGGALGHVAKWR